LPSHVPTSNNRFENHIRIQWKPLWVITFLCCFLGFWDTTMDIKEIKLFNVKPLKQIKNN
jgi:hypothetical protein